MLKSDPQTLPPDGKTVVLRMTDTRGNISYGIGWWNAREKAWVITAKPNSGTQIVHSWAQLPGD